MDNKGSSLIAQEKICKPKLNGGLGILDTAIQKKALLLKNIFKFFNKQDIPWINLIWEKYYSTAPPMDKLEGSLW